MNNNELRELVHLLLMCGIMDKTALESGNVTNEEWLRMQNLIEKYQTEGGINCEPDKSGDLISREVLKGLITDKSIPIKFEEGERGNWRCSLGMPLRDIYKTIDNAPTVAVNCKDCDGYEAGYSAGLKDAERPQDDIFPMELVAGKCPIEAGGNCPLKSQGEWINHRNDNGHNIADCSLCGKTTQWHDEDEDGIPRYCWYCGASMKGDAE